MRRAGKQADTMFSLHTEPGPVYAGLTLHHLCFLYIILVDDIQKPLVFSLGFEPPPEAISKSSAQQDMVRAWAGKQALLVTGMGTVAHNP